MPAQPPDKAGPSLCLPTGTPHIVGGPNGQTGAAWVYTRNGGVWSQQGGKLLANDAAGPTFQGYSVALSADGNTAIVGGFYDNAGIGATWVYTRSGSIWSQQGRKLVGTNAVGNAQQGYSVALSADGNTAIVGGPDGQTGAAWVFVQPSRPTIKGVNNPRTATLTINPQEYKAHLGITSCCPSWPGCRDR